MSSARQSHHIVKAMIRYEYLFKIEKLLFSTGIRLSILKIFVRLTAIYQRWIQIRNNLCKLHSLEYWIQISKLPAIISWHRKFSSIQSRSTFVICFRHNYVFLLLFSLQLCWPAPFPGTWRTIFGKTLVFGFRKCVAVARTKYESRSAMPTFEWMRELSNDGHCFLLIDNCFYQKAWKVYFQPTHFMERLWWTLSPWYRRKLIRIYQFHLHWTYGFFTFARKTFSIVTFALLLIRRAQTQNSFGTNTCDRLQIHGKNVL